MSFIIATFVAVNQNKKTMARPIKEETAYKVTLHINNGYRYAALRPRVTNEKTGKRMNKSIHIGTVTEDLKFIPNKDYLYMSPEERHKLVFPEGWDLSETEHLPSERKAGRPSYKGEERNSLYGDVWLMEQVAERTGIREDLEKVFDGNKEMVGDILTLAMFPYITGFSYSRMSRWQGYTKTPSVTQLLPSTITRLTQSIKEHHRMSLLSLRAMRMGKNELCAADSTSRSAYGDSLTDTKWGLNKEGVKLQQTNEVVVYSLDSHMPVYYRTFPGNIPDSRTMNVIRKDLREANFDNYVMITDRGYNSLQNLEDFISSGQKAIMCMKTSTSMIMRKIEEIDISSDLLDMKIDSKKGTYYRQYDMEYKVTTKRGKEKAADRMKINLYFDPSKRSAAKKALDIDVDGQREALQAILDNREQAPDEEHLKKEYRHFDVSVDGKSGLVTGFSLNLKKYQDSLKTAGFMSLVTLGLDIDAREALEHYSLRDEQEKYFQQMKSEMVSDRQRNWSEDGKTGRLFILFVGLIIGSYIRHIWKTTELKKIFPSSLTMLDEMRSIRYIEREGHLPTITPFVGKQVDIAKAFGFEIPKGCAPGYTSVKVEKKRGRPKKIK